jgi:hypothetical protein
MAAVEYGISWHSVERSQAYLFCNSYTVAITERDVFADANAVPNSVTDPDTICISSTDRQPDPDINIEPDRDTEPDFNAESDAVSQPDADTVSVQFSK